MKNLIQPLAKSFLIPLVLIAAASAADAGTHKTKIQALDLQYKMLKWETL